MSLTRDFSVFIDLSGGRDLVNVLANGYYMHFAFFVKGCKTINPNYRAFVVAYWSFIDHLTRMSRIGNGKIISQPLLEDNQHCVRELLEYFLM